MKSNGGGHTSDCYGCSAAEVRHEISNLALVLKSTNAALVSLMLDAVAGIIERDETFAAQTLAKVMLAIQEADEIKLWKNTFESDSTHLASPPLLISGSGR